MKKYFKHHYYKYPQSGIQDYLKLLKQICYGPKHFFKSEKDYLEKLTEEIKSLGTDPFYEDLYEPVGPDFVRINLRPFVSLGLDVKWLNSAFLKSVGTNPHIDINAACEELSLFLQEIFSKEEVEREIEKYRTEGFPTLSHSGKYREAYRPAYRIVDVRFIDSAMKTLQIKNFLNRLPRKDLTVLAIDGPSASGKSTISERLEDVATVIHADDFFDGSDAIIGINSERIKEEVLLPLHAGAPLEYRRFNCTEQVFVQERIDAVKPIVILEGVYSANSRLRDFFDAVIYCDIPLEEQLTRLKNRSERLFPRFLNEWLPREKKYFQDEEIFENSDLIV